jgi:hypothetical protein
LSLSQKNYYLARTTRGKVRVYKPLIVEVCGFEQVSLNKQELLLQYTEAHMDKTTVPLSEYKNYFESSS